MAISALSVSTPKIYTHHSINAIAASKRPNSFCSSKPNVNAATKLSWYSNFALGAKKWVFDVGIGILAASVVAISPLDAEATRIEYYATVADPPCDFNFANSGLGYCEVQPSTGVEAPYGELINEGARSLSSQYSSIEGSPSMETRRWKPQIWSRAWSVKCISEQSEAQDTSFSTVKNRMFCDEDLITSPNFCLVTKAGELKVNSSIN